jgi:hypothetical protein
MRYQLRNTSFLLLLAASVMAAVPESYAQDARLESPGAPGAGEGEPGEGAEYVELETGEVLYGRVEFHKPEFSKGYLMIDKSTRVEAEDVRAYQNEDGYFRRVSGRPPKFARRVRRGRLDLYERAEYVFSPMIMMPGAPGAPPIMMGGHGGDVSFGYFAKGEGDVHPLKYGPLREAVSDDPASLRHLNQYRALGYVQIGLVAGGLGLIVASLAQLEPKEDPPPMLFVGAGVAVTAWVPHLLRSGKLEAAVNTYNRYRLEE